MDKEQKTRLLLRSIMDLVLAEKTEHAKAHLQTISNIVGIKAGKQITDNEAEALKTKAADLVLDLMLEQQRRKCNIDV